MWSTVTRGVVCLSITSVSAAKTVEPIEMPFVDKLVWPKETMSI